MNPEGKIVRIYMSYVEPVDKGLLWMRPCLWPKQGYDLLYFGSKGWTVWLPGCNKPKDNGDMQRPPFDGNPQFNEDGVLTDICNGNQSDVEVTPDNDCGCNQ